MTALDPEKLAAFRRDFPGPIVVVAGRSVPSEFPFGVAGPGVFVLVPDLAAARSLAPIGHAAMVVPRTLEEFLRESAVCPAVVVFGEEPVGPEIAAAIRALRTFGAVGMRVIGLGAGDFPDFRRSDGGALELVTVNGRRPAGLDGDSFARLAALLGETFSSGNSEDDCQRAVTEILGEIRRESVLGQRSPRGWPFADVPETLPPTMPDGRPWPRVSVITASYQQGRYIEENILSVLRQNYPNLEHIICDGGSRDETPAILRRYDAHLAFWVSEKDGGQSAAINHGFRRATGEIVTWLNSDDMFAPGALAAAVVALVTTGADMVAGIAVIHQEGRVESRHLTSCGDGPLPLADLLNLDECWLRGQFFYQPEVLFTRALWERAGGHVREDLHYSMDYELWLRMARAGARLTVIGTPIALFRKHEEQKTFLTESYEPELRALRDAFAAEHGLAVPPHSEIPESKRLKIVFFNDNGFRFGAGIGHRRLVEALQLSGHHVVCLGAKDVRRGADMLSPVKVADTLLGFAPDVIFFGNLHGANLGSEVVSLVARHGPAVFFMHDYWLITGRCAYMKGCEKYLEGCDETCPTPEEYPALAPAKIRDAWERKERLHFGGAPVQIATNSRAVADVVDGFLAHRRAAGRAEVINLPLPLHDLHAADRATCRGMLGIPADAFLVLFSAGRLDEPRKGMDLLLAAFKLSGIPNLHLGCLGREESAAQLAGEQRLHCFGYVNDPAALARIYSAADVYVGPSRDETFGQVFTEAAACGTPSIGFRVGGVAEAIIDDWSGVLAGEISAESLAQALVRIWSDPAKARSLALLGPALVRGRFAPEKTANQLHGLLERILAPRGKRLGRKLDLQLRKPALAEVARIPQGFVRYLEGFDRMEPSTIQQRAMTACWVYAPKAEFDLTTESGGRFHLVLHYICALKNQVLSVRTPSRFLGKFPLDHAPGQLRTIEIPFHAPGGTQRITIYPKSRSHHQAVAPERSAFRLYGLALVPRSE